MFLLHLYYPESDITRTIAFASPFLRALHVIALAGQPVITRLEDLKLTDDAEAFLAVDLTKAKDVA